MRPRRVATGGAGVGSVHPPPAAAASAPRRRVAEALVRLAFGRLLGWQGGQGHGLEHHAIRGIDSSLLRIALARSTQVPTRGAVLLCHPLLKYGMSYFWHAQYHRWLCGAGYHAVGFDFKGFGRSELRGISFPDDVVSAALWARRQFPDLPLHLLGASFGACHAIHGLAQGAGRTLGAPAHGGSAEGTAIASAVFDSAPVDIAHFLGRGWAGALMRGVAASRWARPAGMRPIVESLPAVGPLPCLFLYGSADPYVSPAEIERVRQACRGAEIRIFEGCGHLALRQQRPDAYIEAVLAFFASHAGPGHRPTVEQHAKDTA